MEVNDKSSVKLWDAVPGFDFNAEVDVPEMHSYFHDGVHSVPRLTPMFSWLYGRANPMGSQYACEVLSVPKSKGWAQKIKDGATYVAMHIVHDDAEIAKRTARFQEAMIPWIEDFDGQWAAQKSELLDIYGKLKSLDLDKAGNIDLLHHLWDMIAGSSMGWMDPEFLRRHSETGAEIIAKLMRRLGADPKIIERVKFFVAGHEFSGANDQNLIKDADSVSFFENNVEEFLHRKVKMFGKEKVRAKFEWMFERISTHHARQMAEPMYKRAMESLVERE